MQRALSVPLRPFSYRASSIKRHFSPSAIMARVKVLNSFEEYKQAINGDKPAVIDFHAVWCGPCKVISPRFNSFSDEFEQLEFYSVDVDEQPEIAQDCKIQAMPTFQVHVQGRKVDEFKGAFPDKLKAMIEKAAGAV